LAQVLSGCVAVMASFTKGSKKAGGEGARGGAWSKVNEAKKQQNAMEKTGGGGILSRIAAIELEMARTQKNKATATHLGSLKAKLCQLRRELLEPKSAGAGKGAGFECQRKGDARVGLLGFPSVGKSSLLTGLTGVESEAAAYEFTTLTCIPGIINYNDAKIQLLDLPGIIKGAANGAGRGRQVIATLKSCDVIIMVLDATKDDQQKAMLEHELDIVGIRLNRRSPDISFTKTKTGGLRFNSIVQQTQGFDQAACHSVLQQYKLFNADVVVREDVTVDDFIDVIEGNRKYCPCIYVYNKIDMLSIPQIDELARRPNTVPISVNSKMNLDGLLERLWEELALVRVYTKKPRLFPDFEDPIVITPQRGNKTSNVENAVTILHKQLLEEFKHCLVWGRSVKQSPAICGLKHDLMDEDVIQIQKMTPAEKARAAHGKKTGTTLPGTNIRDENKKKEAKKPLKS